LQRVLKLCAFVISLRIKGYRKVIYSVFYSIDHFALILNVIFRSNVIFTASINYEIKLSLCLASFYCLEQLREINAVILLDKESIHFPVTDLRLWRNIAIFL
jgi:hypothetical protein